MLPLAQHLRCGYRALVLSELLEIRPTHRQVSRKLTKGLCIKFEQLFQRDIQAFGQGLKGAPRAIQRPGHRSCGGSRAVER